MFKRISDSFHFLTFSPCFSDVSCVSSPLPRCDETLYPLQASWDQVLLPNHLKQKENALSLVLLYTSHCLCNSSPLVLTLVILSWKLFFSSKFVRNPKIFTSKDPFVWFLKFGNWTRIIPSTWTVNVENESFSLSIKWEVFRITCWRTIRKLHTERRYSHIPLSGIHEIINDEPHNSSKSQYSKLIRVR